MNDNRLSKPSERTGPSLILDSVKNDLKALTNNIYDISKSLKDYDLSKDESQDVFNRVKILQNSLETLTKSLKNLRRESAKILVDNRRGSPKISTKVDIDAIKIALQSLSVEEKESLLKISKESEEKSSS